MSGENGCEIKSGFRTDETADGGMGGSPEPAVPCGGGFEIDALRVSSFSFFGAAFTYGFGTIAARDVAMIAEER
jgi:hypothetical protein